MQGEIEKLVAERREREEEAKRMQGVIEKLVAEKQDAQAEREKLKALQASLSTPSYWETKIARASGDGFALVSLDRSKDGQTWQALAALLVTDGSQLDRGADLKHKSGAYDRLRLAAAWRVENLPLWDKYAGGRHTVAAGLQRVLKAGKPERNVGCRLHDAASRLPGGLSPEAKEEMLLHGTSPASILSIVSTGFNEHFSGASAGTAFGDGIYTAEDCGKTDHYVTMDSAAARSGGLEALHQRLFANGAEHPGRVFYVFACRVATGYIVRTQTAHDAKMKSPDTGEQIFVSLRGRAVTRELAPVSGIEPPVPHNTLLAEDHSGGGPYRYREFIVFQNANIYPEYLLAYQRFNGALGPLP